MADKLHWHQDSPLPLHPSHNLDQKPPHEKYKHLPYLQYTPYLSPFCGRGRGPSGRGGRWGSHSRGGRGTPSREAPLGHPSVSRTNMVPPSGDVASAQSALMSLSDLEGASPLTWPIYFVPTLDTPRLILITSTSPTCLGHTSGPSSVAIA
jgi:hypothetical protein